MVHSDRVCRISFRPKTTQFRAGRDDGGNQLISVIPCQHVPRTKRPELQASLQNAASAVPLLSPSVKSVPIFSSGRNAGHRDIAGPLGGLLRVHGRPQHKAAALTLAMLRQLVATCDDSPRGRRDRALLLIGFAGALRRSELVALRVEDVALVASGLRVRIRRGKTDAAGEGAEIGLPRGRHAETCPVRALEAWQAVAQRKAGPLFRRVGAGGGIGDTALHPDAVRRILAHRVALAGLDVDGFERLSAHALRVGFITAAYDKGVRDAAIMPRSSEVLPAMRILARQPGQARPCEFRRGRKMCRSAQLKAVGVADWQHRVGSSEP